jgi:transcriptional regulator of arginine metabolism
MSIKAERQRALLEIVATRAVATQAELKELLRARGFAADQGTISRDVRELGLVKVSDDGVHYRYAPVEAVAPPSAPKAGAILARLVRKVDWSGNLLVVKTDPGEAGPVGLALDRMGWPEVVGTVAGDDTLLVVVREGASARKLARKIMDLKTHKREPA